MKLSRLGRIGFVFPEREIFDAGILKYPFNRACGFRGRINLDYRDRRRDPFFHFFERSTSTRKPLFQARPHTRPQHGTLAKCHARHTGEWGSVWTGRDQPLGFRDLKNPERGASAEPSDAAGCVPLERSSPPLADTFNAASRADTRSNPFWPSDEFLKV